MAIGRENLLAGLRHTGRRRWRLRRSGNHEFTSFSNQILDEDDQASQLDSCFTLMDILSALQLALQIVSDQAHRDQGIAEPRPCVARLWRQLHVANAAGSSCKPAQVGDDTAIFSVEPYTGVMADDPDRTDRDTPDRKRNEQRFTARL